MSLALPLQLASSDTSPNIRVPSNPELKQSEEAYEAANDLRGL